MSTICINICHHHFNSSNSSIQTPSSTTRKITRNIFSQDIECKNLMEFIINHSHSIIGNAEKKKSRLCIILVHIWIEELWFLACFVLYLFLPCYLHPKKNLYKYRLPPSFYDAKETRKKVAKWFLFYKTFVHVKFSSSHLSGLNYCWRKKNEGKKVIVHEIQYREYFQPDYSNRSKDSDILEDIWFARLSFPLAGSVCFIAFIHGIWSESVRISVVYKNWLERRWENISITIAYKIPIRLKQSSQQTLILAWFPYSKRFYYIFIYTYIFSLSLFLSFFFCLLFFIENR